VKAFAEIDLERYQIQLDNHTVYEKIETLADLRLFMEHHVYCVWDFMSLLKFLQSELTPVSIPWMPSEDSEVQRLINEIVVEEETDELPNGTFTSHFNMYLEAMKEVGADILKVKTFLNNIKTQGLAESLISLPGPSKEFTFKTFSFIKSGNPHIAAVAFCIGRESIIPVMFSRLIEKCGIAPAEAPMFHYYLQRHIEIDGEKHGPMALNLLNKLCGDDPDKIVEARQTAEEAVAARVKFMDDLQKELEAQPQLG
jgi:hypothetical protein